MKAPILTTALLLLSGIATVSVATAQNRSNDSISTSFAVDGQQVACTDLKIAFRIEGQRIVPRRTHQGFVVPAILHEQTSDSTVDRKLDVNVVCNEYRLEFDDVPAAWVNPGRWEVGIAYPPYWIERFGWTTAIEEGTWVSYLESECNGCDPGVFTTRSHLTPPQDVVARLRKDQVGASVGRARDIAYALAVFGVDYQSNRDLLMQSLQICLSRPKESPEDDVCDSTLLKYMTNLYWRGDPELLLPLLQLADYRKDVLTELGYFYGDLLDRHTSDALREMEQIPVDKQRVICRLAAEDDFSLDPPKLDRVSQRLRAAATPTATRCLKETIAHKSN